MRYMEINRKGFIGNTPQMLRTPAMGIPTNLVFCEITFFGGHNAQLERHGKHCMGPSAMGSRCQEFVVGFN